MGEQNIPRIGLQIRAIRVLRNLDQPGLAKLTDLHPTTISKIEIGGEPREATLKRIEAALRFDFSDPENQAAFAVLARPTNGSAPDSARPEDSDRSGSGADDPPERRVTERRGP